MSPELSGISRETFVIEGAGHFVAEEAPTEMLEALTAFLAPYREGAAVALASA